MESLQKSVLARKGFNAVLAGIFVVSFGGSVAQATILPENDLWKYDGLTKGLGITQTEFNDSIDEVMAIYEPIMEAFGAQVKVEKLWNDPTVNARARRDGNRWVISMYGGLARRAEVTRDGMQMVVCHEIGHHLAGFPFYSTSATGSMGWAAAEGASDYFASHECLRRVWKEGSSGGSFNLDDVHPRVRTDCDKVWNNSADQEVCYRLANASLSVSRLLGAIASRPVVPEFDKNDPNVVTRTNIAHPAAQCRLDTFMQGALCKAEFDPTKIPGRSNAAGQGSLDAEREMADTSCTAHSGFEVGLRPRCWFSPRL
jgi:hypothetical protein